MVNMIELNEGLIQGNIKLTYFERELVHGMDFV